MGIKHFNPVLCLGESSGYMTVPDWHHVFCLQLDLLEVQRKKILSQSAFAIQCCWRRYQRRRRRQRQQSATLIQAGTCPVWRSRPVASLSDPSVWSPGASWLSLSRAGTPPNMEAHLINSEWHAAFWMGDGGCLNKQCGGSLFPGLNFFCSCSRAVMAHQEEGSEVGPSRCCNPEHLEDVEGKSF